MNIISPMNREEITAREDERDVRKKTLENRIKLYEQMEKFCYDERYKLEKELEAIEDVEAQEDEIKWQKRIATGRIAS